MKQKRKTEVVSPVLERKIWPKGHFTSFYESSNRHVWCDIESLSSLFVDPSSTVRIHVVPRRSKWTMTLKLFPGGTILVPGLNIYICMAYFLADARKALTGCDHGEVHFWLENL